MWLGKIRKYHFSIFFSHLTLHQLLIVLTVFSLWNKNALGIQFFVQLKAGCAKVGLAVICDTVLQNLFTYSFYIIGIFNDCIYLYQKELSKVSQNVQKMTSCN